MAAKQNLMKVLVISLLVISGLAVLVVGPGAPRAEAEEHTGDSLYPVSNYGWLTYYMHEVWYRYTDAKQAFEDGDMKQAKANLIVMEIFLEASKDKLPDKLADGRPFNKEEYRQSMDKLDKYSENIRGNLKENKWADVPEGEKDPVLQSCVGCHDAYNIPTDFRIDTAFKKLTHYMHEIYELYRQAGVQFMKGESTGKEKPYDKAKYCFIVCRPYIEKIPKNIPQKNQDGQAIDKELFNSAYNKLKQYNEDMIQKLETKYWKKGKPLPPPKIVVDTCYACHAKVVKIENPW